MIIIDGSAGEGGGQILRSALTLSLVTGQPFRIEKIRAGRKVPGLLRQHLTAVSAAAEISQGEVTGNSIGSTQLTFIPGRVRSGEYSFAVGTAGSATLVFQTVLPALMTATNGNAGRTTIVLEGGTHNPFAPPLDFLERAFLPLIRKMGPQVSVESERPGFYPAGGGRFTATIEPADSLSPIELNGRGAIQARRARAVTAHLSPRIAERELALIREKMSWPDEWLKAERADHSRGPGNVVLLEIESEHVTEVFTGFGERGRRAEDVADQAVQAARRYLAAEVAVGEYLADQLMIPLALAGGGSWTTLPLSRHSVTNLEVIRKFLDVRIETQTLAGRTVRVAIGTQVIA
ncbi:MAG: RNA 3'-terminal phosphate cyclase [Blastocatellia bacterium]